MEGYTSGLYQDTNQEDGIKIQDGIKIHFRMATRYTSGWYQDTNQEDGIKIQDGIKIHFRMASGYTSGWHATTAGLHHTLPSTHTTMAGLHVCSCNSLSGYTHHTSFNVMHCVPAILFFGLHTTFPLRHTTMAGCTTPWQVPTTTTAGLHQTDQRRKKGGHLVHIVIQTYPTNSLHQPLGETGLGPTNEAPCPCWILQ